jgi:hypothetical protein
VKSMPLGSDRFPAEKRKRSFRPEQRGRPEPPEVGAKFNPMLARLCTERYWPFPIQTHRAVQPAVRRPSAASRPPARLRCRNYDTYAASASSWTWAARWRHGRGNLRLEGKRCRHKCTMRIHPQNKSKP